jgi:hypothetical protein
MKMKTSTLLILVALTAGSANAADAGLPAIEQLGQINGQALACSEQDVAARAKQLMLIHAPRTSQYGTVYEQATQKGFMNQVQGQSSACPPAGVLAQRLDTVAKELREKLPAVE